jgi:hypothetical protein
MGSSLGARNRSCGYRPEPVPAVLAPDDLVNSFEPTRALQLIVFPF